MVIDVWQGTRAQPALLTANLRTVFDRRACRKVLPARSWLVGPQGRILIEWFPTIFTSA